MKTNKQSLIAHPIQLVFIGVKELSIIANVPPSRDKGMQSGETSLSLTGKSTAYDEENHQVHVIVTLQVGADTEEAKNTNGNKSVDRPPYTMRIELIGMFQVDESRFDRKDIQDWARRGSIYILSPYIREYAYSLSQKAGFDPLILPLVEVPTITYSAKS